MDNTNFNQQPANQKPVAPQPIYASQPTIPAGYEPISMWGYFGYELLFSIPCIGFIFLCVFAFGGTQNVNLKNFARSYFCFLIIAVVLLVVLLVLTGGIAAIASMDM